MHNAHLAVVGNAADFDGIQAPFFEDLENFLLAALLRHQQHALLGLTQHDLVGGHAGLALRHQVEFDLGADMAAGTHFAS